MPKTMTPRQMTMAEYAARNKSLLAAEDDRTPLAKAVNWTPNKSELVRDLLSGANDVTGRGAIAGLLGTPGDIAGLVENAIRAKAGLPAVQPWGGSEHIGQKLENAGLVSSARRPKTELLASLISPGAALKTVLNAPKTAMNLLRMSDNLAAPSTMARAGQRGAIDVWHGSPHDYEKFSAMDNIGLGQGGGSFGVGGYHASSKSVASEPQYVGASGVLYKNQLRWPNAARESADPLSESHFLDWDKPLEEQSDYVKNVIANLDEDEWYRLVDNLEPDDSGRTAYDLARLQFDSREAASRKLYEAGIAGIKFNDSDTIHRLGTNTQNYVTFDDALVNILEKSKLPGK